MIINQLFKESPSRDLAQRLACYFGLTGLDDSSYFSREWMQKHSTIKNIKENLLDELKKLYIQCKAKSYLSDIDEKSALTILRQILRVHGYNIISRSKCRDGVRFLEYRVIQAT